MKVGPSTEVRPQLGFATAAWLQFVEHDDKRVDLVRVEHHQHKGLLSVVVDENSEREASARRAALEAVHQRTGLPWRGQ